MSLLQKIQRWFNNIRLTVKILAFLNEYGPDMMEVRARDLSYRDQVKIALQKWRDELWLLGHRYEVLMRLVVEDSSAALRQEGANANGIRGDGPGFVPMEELPPALFKKLQEFVKDEDRLRNSAEAARCLHHQLEKGYI